MKKLLLILILWAGVSQAQTIPVAQLSFSTITDLRAQAGTSNSLATLNGLSTLNDGNGGTYMWSSSSSATDDGFTVVKVGNVTTGRWLRIGNGNTIKGTVTTSGAALQTAYTVSYQTGTLPFVPITVIINPRSSNAAVPSWISAITNTGFTINFASVPILGTNNIVFDYIVVKQ